MESINEILSEEYRVKPLAEGVAVTYRLLRAGVLDPNTRDQEDNKLISTPAGHHLSPRISIRDNGHKPPKTITIGNIVGQIPITKDGKTELIPKFEGVSFNDRGVVVCNSMNEGTYFLMERHPRNLSNPFRDRTKKPLFYRVDLEGDTKIALEKEFAKIDMLAYVRDITDRKDLFALAASLNASPSFKINLNEGIDFIKATIIGCINKNPYEVIKYSDNQEAIFKLKVTELISTESVVFDDKDIAKRQWKVKRPVGEKGIKVLCDIPVGMNPMDGLISYILSDEGSTAREAIEEKHEQFFGALA